MCEGTGAVPTGLVDLFLPAPGTYVPGYHIPPLRGWIWVRLSPPLFREFYLTHLLREFSTQAYSKAVFFLTGVGTAEIVPSQNYLCLSHF